MEQDLVELNLSTKTDTSESATAPK